jgi:hypothetical protein
MANRWNLPHELRVLPFDLMRSHLYPRDPEIVGAAIMQYPEERKPTYVPSSVMQSRWKTNPDGGRRGQYEGVPGLVAVLANDSGSVLRQAVMAAPGQSIAQYASGMMRLPQPDSTTRAYHAEQVISRGLPVSQPPVPPAALDMYGWGAERASLLKRTREYQARHEALSTVDAQLDQLHQMLFGRPR